MTGVQPRDESAGDSSDDDEPLSTLTKCKRTSERTKYSEEAQSPGHSSDDETLDKLMESKGPPPASSDRHQEPDSEDEKGLMTQRKKKRKKRKPETEEAEVLDANKTKHPKKDDAEEKASKLRKPPPPSPPRAKATQKRGRKSKEETRRMASVHSKPENTAPKKRGRPKKEDRERKVSSADSSDDEPLTRLVKKKQWPEMKQAVVLLKRMSKRDVIDMITQGHTHGHEETSTPRSGAECEPQRSDEDLPSHKDKRVKRQSKPVRNRTTDASSEDEPLVRRVKAVPVKKKCGKRTNGEEDIPKKPSELGEELKNDSGDEYLAKRKSDRAAQTLHRETST